MFTGITLQKPFYGDPYYSIDGIFFEDKNGASYTGTRVEITFYTDGKKPTFTGSLES